MDKTAAINVSMIQDAELEHIKADLIEQLSILSSKDLKAKIKQHNEDFNLSQGMAGYVPVSTTKDEMIDSLIAAEVSNTVHDRPVSEVSGFTAEVSLSQVEMSPFNFRNPIDYEDSQLARSIQASGGLLKAPIVRATDRVDNQGRAIYEIVGGNRSTEALKRVVAASGGSIDEHLITVIVRNYSGTELQQYMQESLEMIMDNESQRQASPQDRLRAYKHLVELGLTQTAIGEKLGVSTAYISTTLRLSILPERIMDLVHFEFNKELIARETPETLDAFKVPHAVNEDGSVTVHGITLDNATRMVELFPKLPAKSSENYIPNKAHYDAEVRRISKFLESQSVIDLACFSPRSEFKNRLREMAISAGVIKEATSTPKVEAEVEVQTVPVTVGSAPSPTLSQIVQADEAAVTAPQPVENIKVSVSEQHQEPVQQSLESSGLSDEKGEYEFTTYEDSIDQDDSGNGLVMRSAYEAGQDLLAGELVFAEDCVKIFSDLLKMGDAKAYSAFKYLFSQDIVVENLGK